MFNGLPINQTLIIVPVTKRTKKVNLIQLCWKLLKMNHIHFDKNTQFYYYAHK